jgi:cysteine-rich repeat protein
VRQGVETCDDGNELATDACPSGPAGTCQGAFCGDGFAHAGVEECDDANQDSADACVAGCRTATCGDGFTHVDVEQCDDGNGSNADVCVVGCVTATCGDGFTRAPASSSATRARATTIPRRTRAGRAVWRPSAATASATAASHATTATTRTTAPDGAGGTCQSARCGDGFGLGAMHSLPPWGALGLELRADLGLARIDGQGDGDEIRNAALTLLLAYLY